MNSRSQDVQNERRDDWDQSDRGAYGLAHKIAVRERLDAFVARVAEESALVALLDESNYNRVSNPDGI